MNEEQGLAQKKIDGSLRQIKNDLADLNNLCGNLNRCVNRIEDEPPMKGIDKPPSVDQWDGLSLTGKIRQLEEQIGLTRTSYEALLSRLDKLV